MTQLNAGLRSSKMKKILQNNQAFFEIGVIQLKINEVNNHVNTSE